MAESNPKTIRIGNGCGFWGDNLDAPIILAEKGKLDYLTLEYLAELTMSIMALQKQKNPDLGYATDFLDVLERLTPVLKRQPKLKIVTNAGGMNPEACAERAREILSEGLGYNKSVATVTGDDLMPRLDELIETGCHLAHMDTGAHINTIRERIVSANAYIGAKPIADALEVASIVITGRVADASLTVGPAMHEFGWHWDDWDKLSSATVAGHLIECGAQCTGGLWCNWDDAKDMANVGYPFVDIDSDGSFIVSKPDMTGGVVDVETVSEQLLYEVGDPRSYMTPDVFADFTTVSLEETDVDQVAVSGAKGRPASDSYKVSISYRCGYTAAGTLAIFGPDAMKKADHSASMIQERLRRAGVTLDRFHHERLGAGDVVPGVPAQRVGGPEVILRVSVFDQDRASVQRFAKELAPLATSGLPGTAGYATGRAQVREVFDFWPALVPKKFVDPHVEIKRNLILST